MFGLGSPPRRPLAVAFDVIGTVFPLEPMRARLIGLGLPPSGLEGWFAAGLRDAFALAAAREFKPFAEVLACALDEVLAEQGLSPPEAERKLVLKALEHLPARPDACGALAALRGADIQVLAVSNESRLWKNAIGAVRWLGTSQSGGARRRRLRPA